MSIVKANLDHSIASTVTDLDLDHISIAPIDPVGLTVSSPFLREHITFAFSDSAVRVEELRGALLFAQKACFVADEETGWFDLRRCAALV